MPIQAQSADGAMHEFPDGTDGSVVDRVMKEYAAKQQPSVGMDIAKSAGVGLGKGLIGGTVALPGNIVDLAGRGARWAGGKMGVELPDPNEYNPLPTSESVRKQVEQVTGPFYKPQTKAGKYAETIGEFAGGPTSYVGKGVSLGRKLAGAVAEGTASETAGQMTEGSDYEPLARLAGGVAGGRAAATGRRGTGTVSDETLRQNAKAGYQTLENSNVTINGDQFVRVMDTFEGQLRQTGHRPYNAKPVWDVLDDIRADLTDASGKVRDVNMQDIKGFRTLLKNVRGTDVDREAAGRVGDLLDKYLSQVPKHHVISGDPVKDTQLLKQTNADYRGLKRSEALSDLERDANTQAQVSGVGANKENALRQGANRILKSKTESLRYNQQELDVLREVADGTFLINESRRIGKFAPSSVVSSAPTLAALLSGHPTIAAAIAGPTWLAKYAGENATRKKVQGLAEDIRSRTPSGQAYTPPVPSATPYEARGAAGALPGAQEHRPLQVDVTWPLSPGGGSSLAPGADLGFVSSANAAEAPKNPFVKKPMIEAGRGGGGGGSSPAPYSGVMSGISYRLPPAQYEELAAARRAGATKAELQSMIDRFSGKTGQWSPEKEQQYRDYRRGGSPGQWQEDFDARLKKDLE